jgi:hypothetical protein
LRLEHGGPPVWSVALCEAAQPSPGFVFATYGLSRAIDPASPFDHELSIRVPKQAGESPPMWPTLLLRHLARYQLTSGSELRVGDFMPLGQPISRVAVPPHLQETQPDTPLRSIAVTSDRHILPKPAGTAPEMRRVYGLTRAEQEHVELWSCSGLMGLIESRDSSLTTDLGRADWAEDEQVRQTCEFGSARDGSEASAISLQGVSWARVADGHTVRFPGGHRTRHLAYVARARLRFQRNLLVHDVTPGPFSEFVLVPSNGMWTKEESDRQLVVGLDANSPALAQLEEAPDPGTEWYLAKG